MGRLTELVAKLEEDLLAADAGGGASGGERHKAGINGIVADGEAQGCRWMQQGMLLLLMVRCARVTAAPA